MKVKIFFEGDTDFVWEEFETDANLDQGLVFDVEHTSVFYNLIIKDMNGIEIHRVEQLVNDGNIETFLEPLRYTVE